MVNCPLITIVGIIKYHNKMSDMIDTNISNKNNPIDRLDVSCRLFVFIIISGILISMIISLLFNIHDNNIHYEIIENGQYDDQYILKGYILDSSGHVANGTIFYTYLVCDNNRQNCITKYHMNGKYTINNYILSVDQNTAFYYVDNDGRHNFVATNNTYYVYGQINAGRIIVKSIYDNKIDTDNFIKSKMEMPSSFCISMIVVMSVIFIIITMIVLKDCMIMLNRCMNLCGYRITLYTGKQEYTLGI